MKNIRKVLVGVGAVKFVPFAKHKLAAMNLITGLPTMKKTLCYKGATIILTKGEDSDKMLIMVSPLGWFAFTNSGLFTVRSQLAFASKPSGPWQERPEDATVVDDHTTFALRGDPLISYNPQRAVMVAGDGRYGIAFAAEGGSRISLWSGKRTFRGYARVTGVNDDGTAMADYGPNRVIRVQPLWARDSRVDNNMAFQLSTLTWRDPPVHVDGPGGGVTHNTVRSLVMDVDYTPLPALEGALQQTVAITDVDIGFYAPTYASMPEMVYLTPRTAMVGTLSNAWGSAASVEKWVAVTTNGGLSWGERLVFSTAYDVGPAQRSLPAQFQERWVPVGGTTALRLCSYTFGPDDTSMALHRFSVDGSMALVCRLPGTIVLPGEFGVSVADNMDLNVLGRDCVVLSIVGRSTQVTDERDPDGIGWYGTKVRYKVFFVRSFNRGETWDSPSDSGFSVSNGVISDNVDNRAYYQLVDPQISSGTTLKHPTTYCNSLYPHKPYVNPQDQGVVYMVARDQYGTTLGGNFVFVSKDACRTWTRLAMLGTKQFVNNFGPTPFNFTLVYNGIVDSGAPIDPIFPWRVDARVAPPDWW